MGSELIWKKSDVAYFQALSRHPPGTTKENNGKIWHTFLTLFAFQTGDESQKQPCGSSSVRSILFKV
jgi:hypothetical protein